MQCGEVVAHHLQPVEQVIKILDFGNGPQSAHGQPQTLPDDGGLADARVEYSVSAVFFLQALIGLVHPADLTHILAKCYDQRVEFEDVIKIVSEDFPSGNVF